MFKRSIYNYFDDSTKLFSDLYLAIKFIDISKLFRVMTGFA